MADNRGSGGRRNDRSQGYGKLKARVQELEKENVGLREEWGDWEERLQQARQESDDQLRAYIEEAGKVRAGLEASVQRYRLLVAGYQALQSVMGNEFLTEEARQMQAYIQQLAAGSGGGAGGDTEADSEV